MWLDIPLRPAWLESQAAGWLDAEILKRAKAPKGTTIASSLVQCRPGTFASHDGGHLEVEMCKKLCEHGGMTDAVDALKRLVQLGHHVPTNLFYFLLKRCSASKDLELSRHVHALSAKCGYEGDDFLANHLIGMYASHGKLEEAMRVFSGVSTPSAHTWASIIFAFAKNGEAAQAIRLYQQLRVQSTTVKVDNRIYSAVLKACASAKDLGAGKEVHAHIVAGPGKPDKFVLSGLLDMYAKCDRLQDARAVFDNFPQRDVVAWNAMLAGYAQKGMGQEALGLYRSMQEEGLSPPTPVTFVCLLQACAGIGAAALSDGRNLHAQIEQLRLQEDVVLGGSLVNMYAKCGSLDDARRVFDRLQVKNLVTWNAMLGGYAQHGMGQEALSLYVSMQEEEGRQTKWSPDSVTFICLLQSCASVGVGALQQGKELHVKIKGQGLQDDVVVGCSLVNMYAKCGSLGDARIVFDRLPDRNVVTWTAMIAGYVQQGMAQEALALYKSMQQQQSFSPEQDAVIYVCLLQACATLGVAALGEGQQLHAQVRERGLVCDLLVGGGLVNMYAKCGSLQDARAVFDRLPHKNIVTWNAMLAGYAQHGMFQETLSLYSMMTTQEGKENLATPDSVTFVCLLQACATVAALPLGKKLHAQIEEQGLQADVVVGCALVNMYAKCGSMSDCQQVFDSLPKQSVEAWSALIGGYTRHGDSQVVFDLFHRMWRVESIQPTDIVFLSLLTVCSHVGLVDKGRHYFKTMETDYGVSPTVDHYTCMMDLLGRAGHLEEALQMAQTMPFQPNDAVWHTLLGACLKWKNVEIGKQAFQSAVQMDEKDDGSYVLMSNIYARAEMWEEAKELQASRVKCGAWKEPGQSWWTDMGGVVHTFVVGDKAHAESEGIYARLETLVPKLKKAGYVPLLQSSLRNVPDSDKEIGLCGHSEKLAIAYALNRTPEGTTIHVVKNLRVCEDCHVATAYVSKVEKRTIICRDASRFHVFKEGMCSCGDYW